MHRKLRRCDKRHSICGLLNWDYNCTCIGDYAHVTKGTQCKSCLVIYLGECCLCALFALDIFLFFMSYQRDFRDCWNILLPSERQQYVHGIFLASSIRTEIKTNAMLADHLALSFFIITHRDRAEFAFALSLWVIVIYATFILWFPSLF